MADIPDHLEDYQPFDMERWLSEQERCATDDCDRFADKTSEYGYCHVCHAEATADDKGERELTFPRVETQRTIRLGAGGTEYTYFESPAHEPIRIWRADGDGAIHGNINDIDLVLEHYAEFGSVEEMDRLEDFDARHSARAIRSRD